MKKIILSILIIGSIFISGCSKKNTDIENENKYPKYVSKCYTSDIDNDGWFNYLCIEIPKVNPEIKEVTSNYEYNDSVNYIIDGINIKYKKLDGYYIPVYNDYEEVTKIDVAYPTYSNSEVYRKEIELINEFLNNKKFNKEIKVSDLEDLSDLKLFSKKEIVSMFNEAINKEPIELGKYIDMPFLIIDSSISNNGYYYQIGTYVEYGNIIKVNIEVIYDNGDYLSDLIDKGKATKEQKQLNTTINEIEEFIINNQELDISKYDKYDESLKLLLNLIKGLNE